MTLKTPVFCVWLSVPGPDRSLPCAEIQDSLWIEVFYLVFISGELAAWNLPFRGTVDFRPREIWPCSPLTDKGLMGWPCFLRGLYTLPHINTPATPEAGAETCAN